MSQLMFKCNAKRCFEFSIPRECQFGCVNMVEKRCCEHLELVVEDDEQKNSEESHSTTTEGGP